MIKSRIPTMRFTKYKNLKYEITKREREYRLLYLKWKIFDRFLIRFRSRFKDGREKEGRR